MPTLKQIRQWLANQLLALALRLDPDTCAVFVVQVMAAMPPAPPTPLQAAARLEVGRLEAEPFSSVSKRQIAHRTLREQFPALGASDVNFALEEAVRDLPRTQTPEAQTHG